MKLTGGEKINEGVIYKVEFTRAEEIAEMGEYAPRDEFTLPYQFDMHDEKIMETFMKNTNKLMESKDYDTMVIKKETYEEFLYLKN